MSQKLEKEVWIADLKENPVPDSSFVSASVDYSEFVENDILHLQEAGASPETRKNYFNGTSSDMELPVQIINDIPHDKALDTFSTVQTRHNNLLEIELSYNKKMSVINRHKNSLARKMGEEAAWQWAPPWHSSNNNVMQVASGASIIDAIIDMEMWFRGRGIEGQMNLCLNPVHLGLIKKEDKKLFKDMFQEPGGVYNNFKLWIYSNNPIYWYGTKQPIGTIAVPGKQDCSFAWITEEVFRSFGSVEMYETLKHSGWQADLMSFAVRAAAGPIRYSNPKNLGAILTTI